MKKHPDLPIVGDVVYFYRSNDAKPIAAIVVEVSMPVASDRPEDAAMVLEQMIVALRLFDGAEMPIRFFVLYSKEPCQGRWSWRR